MVLEIIASSLDDALQAEQGGATRLELCVALEQEGLTMPLELVAEIKSRVSIPLRVMLRETPTYSASESEMLRLQQSARECEAIGVDGLVIGFANEATVDWSLTEILLRTTTLPATMQRAFEFAADPLAAISDLKRLRQFDTLLSNAWGESWQERAKNLETMRIAAEPQVTILAGGGVSADVIRLLRAETGITSFHCGKPARENGKVSAARVELLRQAAEGG
jgi:copper homeostasis protein